MSRENDSHQLGDAIKKMLGEYSLNRKYNEMDLITSWRKMVGDPIANRTRKIYINDRRLFIELESSALKNELIMSRDKILSMIENEFGKHLVEEIVFL